MLPTFWQNPFFNAVLIIFLIGFFSKEAFSQADDQPPGLIEGLQVLIESQREEYQKKIQSIRSRIGIETPITKEELKSAKLEPEFLKSIFLHTESKWLEHLKKNDCSFLALLDNDLIRGDTGIIKTIPVITNKNKLFLVPKNKFIEISLEFKCFNNKQISKLFSRKNLKSTLAGIHYPTPKTKLECHKILDDWKTNPYLPYICRIPEVIMRGRKADLLLNNFKKANFRLSKKLSPVINDYRWHTQNIEFFKRNYLKNICHGLEKKEYFCSPYLAQDVWSKIINGERPKERLLYKCRNLYKKDNININQLKTCAVRMNQSPEICTTKTSEGYPSLFPKPSCKTISTALNSSNLRTPYHDCPANVDNLAVTNIHRLINHLKPRKMISKSESCFSEANYTFAKLNIDFKWEEGWPLRLCYLDRIEDREICKLYIPGHLKGDGEKLSEESVVNFILRRIKGIDNYKKCKFISKAQYNPNLLEYKNGCFIVLDKKKCNNAFCPRKIVLDNHVIKNITYKGKTHFNYFPINYAKRKFSAFNIMSEVYKFNQINIKNLTDLEIFLTKNKNSIAHGVGCAEDLLPLFFKSRTLNQCTPMPFITDGVIRENGNKFLILRTAVDDIHSPRLILWNFVFTALSNFRKMHPLNSWLLYGIKS